MLSIWAKGCILMTVCVLFDLIWLPLLSVGRKSWYIIIIKFAFLNVIRLYLSHICYDVISLWFSYIYYDGIRLRLIIYIINLWEAVFSSNQRLLDRPDSISPNLEYWQAKTQDSALYGDHPMLYIEKLSGGLIHARCATFPCFIRIFGVALPQP